MRRRKYQKSGERGDWKKQTGLEALDVDAENRREEVDAHEVVDDEDHAGKDDDFAKDLDGEDPEEEGGEGEFREEGDGCREADGGESSGDAFRNGEANVRSADGFRAAQAHKSARILVHRVPTPPRTAQTCCRLRKRGRETGSTSCKAETG